MYKYLKNIKRVDFNCFNQSNFKFIKNQNLNTSLKKYSTFNSLKKNILVLKFYFLIKNKIKTKKFFILSFVFFENFYKKFGARLSSLVLLQRSLRIGFPKVSKRAKASFISASSSIRLFRSLGSAFASFTCFAKASPNSRYFFRIGFAEAKEAEEAKAKAKPSRSERIKPSQSERAKEANQSKHKKQLQDLIKDNKLIFSFEINDSITITLNFLFILSFNILFTFLQNSKAKIICLKFRIYNSNKRFQNENKTIINDFGSLVIQDFKKIEKSNKRLSILKFLKRNSIKFIFINFFSIILDFKSSILQFLHSQSCTSCSFGSFASFASSRSEGFAKAKAKPMRGSEKAKETKRSKGFTEVKYPSLLGSFFGKAEEQEERNRSKRSRSVQKAKGAQQNRNSNHIFFIKNVQNWKINKNKKTYLKFFCLKKKELLYFMFFQYIYYYINILFHFYCFSFKKIQYIILIKTFLIKHSSKKKLQFFHYAPGIFRMCNFAFSLRKRSEGFAKALDPSFALLRGFTSVSSSFASAKPLRSERLKSNSRYVEVKVDPPHQFHLLASRRLRQSKRSEQMKLMRRIHFHSFRLGFIRSRSGGFAEAKEAQALASAEPMRRLHSLAKRRLRRSERRRNRSERLRDRRSLCSCISFASAFSVPPKEPKQSKKVEAQEGSKRKLLQSASFPAKQRKRAKKKKHPNPSERKQTAKFFNKISLNNNMFFLFNNKNFLNNIIFKIYNRILFLNNYFSIFFNLKYKPFRMNNLIKSNTFKFLKLTQNIYNIKLLLKFQKIFYCIEMTYFLSRKKFYNKTKKFLFFKIQKLLWNCFILKKKSFLPLYSIIFLKKKNLDFYYHINDNILEKQSVFSIFIKKKLLFFCYTPFFCKMDKLKSNTRLCFHSFAYATLLLHSYYEEAKKRKQKKGSKGIEESKIAALLHKKKQKNQFKAMNIISNNVKKSNKKIEIILGPLKFGLSFELYCNIFSFYTFNSFIKQSIKTIKSNFLFYDCLNFYKKKNFIASSARFAKASTNNRYFACFFGKAEVAEAKDLSLPSSVKPLHRLLRLCRRSERLCFSEAEPKEPKQKEAKASLNSRYFFRFTSAELKDQINNYSSSFAMLLKTTEIKDSYKGTKKQRKSEALKKILIKKNRIYTILSKKQNLMINNQNFFSVLKKLIKILKQIRPLQFILHLKRYIFFTKNLKNFTFFNIILKAFYPYSKTSNFVLNSSEIENYLKSKIFFLIKKFTKINMLFLKKNSISFFLSELKIQNNFLAILLYTWLFQYTNEHTQTNSIISNCDRSKERNQKILDSYHYKDTLQPLLNFCASHFGLGSAETKRVKEAKGSERNGCEKTKVLNYTNKNKGIKQTKKQKKGREFNISSNQKKNNKKEKNEDIKLYNIGVYYGSFLLNFNINIFYIVEILYKNFYISFLKILTLLRFASFAHFGSSSFASAPPMRMKPRRKERKSRCEGFIRIGGAEAKEAKVLAERKSRCEGFAKRRAKEAKPKLFKIRLIKSYIKKNKYSFKTYIINLFKYKFFKSVLKKLFFPLNSLRFFDFFTSPKQIVANEAKEASKKIKEKKYIKSILSLHTKYKKSLKNKNLFLYGFKKFFFNYSFFTIYKNFQINKIQNKSKFFLIKKWDPLKSKYQKISNFIWKKNKISFFYETNYLNIFNNSKFSNCLITDKNNLFVLNSKYTIIKKFTDATIAWNTKFNVSHRSLSQKNINKNKENIFYLKKRKILSLEEMYSFKKNGLNFKGFFLFLKYVSIKAFESKKERFNTKESLIIDKKGCLIKKQIPILKHHKVQNFHQFFFYYMHFHFSSLKSSNYQSKIYKPKTQQKMQYFNLKINAGLIPSKKNLKKHLNLLKNIILKYNSQAQKKLLYKLNYRIMNWSYYYKIVTNSQLFHYCDKIIYKLLWKWACCNHPNKSKKWIQKKYFFSLKNKKWVFGILPKNFDSKSSKKDIFYLPFHNFLIKI
uniref:Group II intron maturase-specific domain-containing protein n=1 Tax=Pediastrum duplex TaxID=3105 RepID=A0A2U8GII7_PEDDU|nr:hypothetical protein [Pediastrum duplex]